MVNPRLITATATLLLLCLKTDISAATRANPVSAFARKPPTVEWNKQKFRVDALPDELLDPAFDAIETWAVWVDDRSYRMLLSDDQRVLFLVSKKQRSADERLEGLVECNERLQTLLGECGSKFRDTVVLVEARDEKDYTSFLQLLGHDTPHLKTAIEVFAEETGFTLSHPPIGGWLERAKDVEQWRPDHEMIHRATRLLLQQRYGDLPPWASFGMAWEVEFALRQRIHCFPYRDEFVKIGEHLGFEGGLRLEFRKRDTFAMDEVIGWEDRHYGSLRAATNWGLVEFLARYRENSLDPILKDLAKAQKRVRNRTGQVNAVEQLAILNGHAGEDLLSQAAMWFRLGDQYDGKN